MNLSPAPVSPITGVKGWETPNEQNLLAILATLINPAVIVEIGSEFGMSASIWSSCAPQAKIFCIDINPDAPFMNNLKKVGLGSNVTSICGDSHLIAKDWRDICDLAGQSYNSIDILFIDGDHSFTGAFNDIARWWDYVSPGGIMALHDVAVPTNNDPHPLHLEVRRAIDTWWSTHKDEVEIIGSIDTILVCRKVG